MKCRTCGLENESGTRFCAGCGAPVPEKKEKTPAHSACPHCQGENPPGARFCQHCGRGMASPAPPPAPPALPRRRFLPVWIWAGLGALVIAAAGGGLLLFARPVAVPSPRGPQPTATHRPVSPAAQASGPEVLLFDDFRDDSGGWPVFGDESGELGYQDGYLRIAFYQPVGFHAAWSAQQYSDFIVETVFSTPAGVPDVGAGFTLRTSENAWYLLWVYPAQRSYLFRKDIGGQVSDLVPLVASTAIQPLERDGRYHLQLKVEARGGRFDIWVGRPEAGYASLDSVTDAELKSGYLGPSADCPDGAFDSPVEVLFDWIRVTE